MSSTYGENLKLSIFGQSHGAAIGITLDGIPAGLGVDLDALQTFLDRRAPGQGDWSTSRKEADQPEFLAGLVDGFTCGAPIAAVIRNTNTRSGDYENLKDCPRPGHADFTAQIKYGGFQDAAGGGHFSGRLTAPLCIAGGLCMQWLDEMGIRIGAHIVQIGKETTEGFDPLRPQLDQVGNFFPTLDADSAERFQAAIAAAKLKGDSVGGMIQCAITGLPAGLGEPMFGGVESRIAQIIYGIPAVKSVAFGIGEEAASVLGSDCNDAFTVDDGRIVTATNRCGGVLGGITTGMPVLFTVAFKPTPSIAKPQTTVSLSRMEETELQVKGRHDPCIVPRAVPVVEAAAAIAVMDMILGNTQTPRRK
jgi:chorismate synthase